MSEADLDQELRGLFQGAVSDQLAGWEFSADMRQKVLDRIAAEERSGSPTVPSGSGASGQVVRPRRPVWRSWYAAVAAVAAVAVIAIATGKDFGPGGRNRTMEQAAQSAPGTESAPSIAADAGAQPQPDGNGTEAGQNQVGITSAEPGVADAASAGAPGESAKADPSRQGEQAGEMQVLTVPSEDTQAPADADVTVAQAVQVNPDATATALGAESTAPTLTLVPSGGEARGAYGPEERVQLHVALRPGTEERWPGPVTITGWIPLSDGTKVELFKVTSGNDIGPGTEEWTADVGWDQSLPGGKLAPAGEYTVYVHAQAADGRSTEGTLVVRLER